MASIVYTISLIASLVYLVRKREEEESSFSLKIIGYFILGSFAFNFNQISLPLGFIVYLLFFRPQLNVEVKRMAALLGLFAFIVVFWILPMVLHVWESRPQYIDHKLDSVYMMNFQDEYKMLKRDLKLENENNDLRLEDFEVDYNKSGSIKDLSWQMLEQNGSSYTHYRITYEIAKSRYRVTSRKLDTWVQYNRLVGADRFFENLNVLDIKKITKEKGDFSSFVLKSTGERINFAIKNRTHFYVSNGEVHPLEDEKLPVEGYYVSTFAMQKTSEVKDDQGNITQESFEGMEPTDYLFDVIF